MWCDLTTLAVRANELDTVFLSFASVMQSFDILPSLDENGNERDPTPEMTSTGIIMSVHDEFIEASDTDSN